MVATSSPQAMFDGCNFSPQQGFIPMQFLFQYPQGFAPSQASWRKHLGPLRTQSSDHCKVLSSPFNCRADKKPVCLWKSLQIPRTVKNHEGRKLVIKSFTALEPECLMDDGSKSCKNADVDVNLDPSTVPLESSSATLSELDETERLRRMRISNANRGKTPWNKGKKLTAETVRRIKEKTRLAMQNPKIRMKLTELGHAQSVETRRKIGIKLQKRWQKHRQKQMAQETCFFEWQNLIAEASRRGYFDEEALQWDSFKILSEKLELEWREKLKQRKTMHRIKRCKRAPKSPEQKRKIAEAIAVKWADPAYREQFSSGMSKYHAKSVGVEKKQRRKPSGTVQSTKRIIKKNSTSDSNRSSKSSAATAFKQLNLQRSKTPLYKDPFESSKLEMINIRAQRAATEAKKIEIIAQARLLIAEAEKAARSLEVTARKSPAARASLMETRKLIAEAVKSIESFDTEHSTSNENDRHFYLSQTELVNEVEKETVTGNGGSNPAELSEVNGTKILGSISKEDLKFTSLTLHNMLNGEKERLPINFGVYGLPPFNLETLLEQSSSANQVGPSEPNGSVHAQYEHKPAVDESKFQCMKEDTPHKSVTAVKKWVRGRLIEVTEEG